MGDRVIVGRQRELDLIDRYLLPGELVALTGASGMGKTTIALEFIAGCEEKCLSVDCFGLSSVDAASSVLTALGALPKGGRDVEVWVLAGSLLSEQNVQTLLLDDIGFDFAALQTLRRCWPGRLLTTSHRVPEFGFVLPVTPLRVGEDVAEALTLFESAARLEDPSFELTSDDRVVAAVIADVLSGHPLAICLAGRRAATTSVATVLDQLRAGDLVRDDDRPERHQSHMAAIALSWKGLGADDQALIYVMALFERPLRVDALAEICGSSLAETLEGIRRLVRAGFVARGEFQQPLDLFRKLALAEFPVANPDQAAAVLSRVREAALRAAHKVEPGLTPLADFGEEPSYWRIFIERDCEGLNDDEAAAVVAAWLRYAAIRSSARGGSDVAIARLLDRVDDSDAWLQAGRGLMLLDVATAESFAGRAVDTATTPRQRHDATALRAMCLGQRFRVDEATSLFDSVFDLEFDTPAVAIIETELRMLCGQRDAARAAVGRLEEMDLSESDRSTMLIFKAWLAEEPTLADAYYRRAMVIQRNEQQLVRYANSALTHAIILVTKLERFEDALAEVVEARELSATMGAAGLVGWSYVVEATVRLLSGDFAGAETASRVPTAQEAGPHAASGDLMWAAALLHQGKLTELRAVWPAILAEQKARPLKFHESMWRSVDLGQSTADQFDALLAEHVRDCAKWAPLFEAIAVVRRSPPQWTFADVLEAWPCIDAVFDLPRRDPGIRHVLLYVKPRLPALIRRLVALRETEADVVVLAEFEGYRVDGVWHDLTQQAVGARLLRLLAESSEPLDHATLGRLLYPDEIVVEESMVNRINVQMSKLRSAGLKPFLVKHREGFALEGAVEIEASPPSQ